MNGTVWGAHQTAHVNLHHLLNGDNFDYSKHACRLFSGMREMWNQLYFMCKEARPLDHADSPWTLLKKVLTQWLLGQGLTKLSTKQACLLFYPLPWVLHLPRQPILWLTGSLYFLIILDMTTRVSAWPWGKVAILSHPVTQPSFSIKGHFSGLSGSLTSKS